jgi:nitrogen regulatory protein PII
LSEHRYYRGVEYDAQAEERISLTVYVEDSKLDDVVQIIKSQGHTGNSTDSYLVVFQLDQVYKLQGNENENEDTLIELK